MMPSRFVRGTVLGLAALMAAAGCGSSAKGADAPGGPIDGRAFDNDPCDAYSYHSLAKVAQPALTDAGWPTVRGPATPIPPDLRLSAHVQRCRYLLTVSQPMKNGDQGMAVFVYNEMSNGRALMDTCKARGKDPAGTTPSPAPQPLGDEACLDEDGQWRFRIGDRYVSVLVNIPPRTTGDGEIVTSSSTGTFTAEPAQKLNTQAAVSRAVAEDLARRLR
jgi:hypothetical protein